MSTQDVTNCGMKELFDLRGAPRETLGKALSTTQDEWSDECWGDPAIVLFSDAVDYGNGRRFAAFLRKSKLGKVVSSKVGYNSNSTNDIQAWLWTVDRKRLAAWAKKRGINWEAR